MIKDTDVWQKKEEKEGSRERKRGGKEEEKKERRKGRKERFIKLETEDKHHLWDKNFKIFIRWKITFDC